MKRRLSALMMFIVAGVALSAEPDDTREVLAKIRQIARDENKSYELILVRAYPVLSNAFYGKAWADIEPAFRAIGLEPFSMVNDTPFSEYKYMVMTNACLPGAVSNLNLYISFGVFGGKGFVYPPDFKVTSTIVGLSAVEPREGKFSGARHRLQRWRLENAAGQNDRPRG